MLHHVSFGVSQIERSAAFYDAVLAPFGCVRVWEDLSPGEADQAVGYGSPGSGDKFAIKLRAPGARPPGPGFHLAFASPDRQAVIAFTKRRSRTAGWTTGRPAFDRITGRTILRHS